MLGWILNLGFAASPSDAPPPVAPSRSAPAGGGRRPRRRKGYPRRIMIDGKLYWVKSPYEEQQLLAQHRDSVEAEALMEALDSGEPAQVAKLRVRVKRAQARIREARSREQEWKQVLEAEDEELLLMMFS